MSETMSEAVAWAICVAVCVGCFWLTWPRRSRRLRRYQRRKQEIVLPERMLKEHWYDFEEQQKG